MKKGLQKVLWNITWIVFRPLLKIFCHFNIRGVENLNINSPFILAIAIHANRLDPYIVSAAFPFNSKAFPIRFATAKIYIDMPILGTIIKCYGAFPLINGVGIENSLKYSMDLLSKNEIVGFFPEGKLSKNGIMNQGKRGVAFISQKMNIPIIPVALSGTFELNPISFILSHNHIKVTFGKAIRINPDQNLDTATDFIMRQIAKMLPVKEVTRIKSTNYKIKNFFDKI